MSKKKEIEQIENETLLNWHSHPEVESTGRRCAELNLQLQTVNREFDDLTAKLPELRENADEAEKLFLDGRLDESSYALAHNAQETVLQRLKVLDAKSYGLKLDLTAAQQTYHQAKKSAQLAAAVLLEERIVAEAERIRAAVGDIIAAKESLEQLRDNVISIDPQNAALSIPEFSNVNLEGLFKYVCDAAGLRSDPASTAQWMETVARLIATRRQKPAA